MGHLAALCVSCYLHCVVRFAIAQALSSRLLTTEASVHFQGSLCGIRGGRSGTGRSLSLVTSLIRVSIMPLMLNIHSYII
jgi:hypothetical protein